jgi:hypothetical protein
MGDYQIKLESKSFCVDFRAIIVLDTHALPLSGCSLFA